MFRTIEWDEKLDTSQKRYVFIMCLLSASHKPTTYKKTKLEPGEFTTSYGAFAKRCMLPKESVRNTLIQLEKHAIITRSPHSQYTKITVKNWHKYQANTHLAHTEHTNLTPIKKKEERNKKKEYIKIQNYFDVSDEINDFFGGIPKSTLLRWSQVYPNQAFCEAAQEIMEYIQSKPKKYKNYRSALNNLLQRNFATKPYYEKYNKSQQDQEHIQNLRNFFDEHAR